MTNEQRELILNLLGNNFSYNISLTGSGFFQDDDFFTNGYIAEVRSMGQWGWGVFYKGKGIGTYRSQIEAYDVLISHLTSIKIAV